MATTSKNTSDEESESEEVFSELSRSDLESCISETLNSYQKLKQKFKAIKGVLEETLEECGKLEITVLELKDENKTLILERDSTKKNCSKLEEALSQAPQTSNTVIYEYEKSFQKFLKNGIERSRMASMIYGVSQNNKRGIGYVPSEDKSSTNDKPKSSFSYHYTHTQAQHFVNSRKPKVPRNFGKTNHKGPKRFWVPKDKIVYVADILCSRVKTPVMVPGL